VNKALFGHDFLQSASDIPQAAISEKNVFCPTKPKKARPR